MNLNSIKHLFKKNDQIAWVGSGGKTTLMFAIANQFYTNAILSTTTHLGIEERSLASESLDLGVKSIKTILNRHSVYPKNTLIYKGYSGPDSLKINAPSLDELKLISRWCSTHSFPLFIEADGSRRTALKAPADHEPAIPEWVTTVCLVAGLGSVGKEINEKNVFRHHRFNTLTNTNEGDLLNLDQLFNYLIDPSGGLKNIPSGAKKILFLHQADLITLSHEIFDFCFRLQGYYDDVILTSFTDQQINIHAHYGKIAGIVLAAGEAKRFGRPKQLAEWKGEPFINHVIHNAVESKLKPIKVILGAHVESIEPVIKKEPVDILINSDWKTGQSSSVCLGVQSLPQDVEAVVFLLVDQPQVTSQQTTKIIHAFAQNKAKIIGFEYKQSFRHPILFSAELFFEFSDLSGDMGGRKLFKKYPPLALKIEDAQLAFDIDTPEDLAKLSSM